MSCSVCALAASETGLVAWWKFDGGDTAIDSINNIKDSIGGNLKYAEGVKRQCIKFDEFTTTIARIAADAPRLDKSKFTVEAWIAPRTYPWNWCPIVMQKDEIKGFFFGLDADGRFGLHVSVDGKWQKCNARAALPGLEEHHTLATLNPKPKGVAKPVLPLLRWSHIVGTFDEASGITMYLNGKEEGMLAVTGKFTPAYESNLYIGRDPKKSSPAHTERGYGTFPINFSFDGLLDEVKIYDYALSTAEVQKAYQKVQPRVWQPLQFRRIPTGPNGPGRFGAYYTHLKYDEDYDRPWRVGEYADVVVMFDEYPFKLVYWHGINYYPIWYAENGVGMMQEACETWGKRGCHEAMMDRQCRFSHVRVIENTDAQVVIHWRHCLVDCFYEPINVDPVTGWSDWSDDYYTIYPDGVAARKITLWSSDPVGNHTFQQENFVIPIGLRPADVLEKKATTIANLKGQEKSYSWEYSVPKEVDLPDPTIQVYNIRAQSKPFIIYQPGVGEPVLGGDAVSLSWPWGLPWWNHWPASQIPSDGRQTFMVDGRPSSTCIAEGGFNKRSEKNERTDKSLSMFMLFGMTMGKTAGQLAPLARSWAQAPKIIIDGSAFVNEGYSVAERCYHIKRRPSGKNNILKFEIKASKDSPVVNPAFLVKNWGESDATLRIDGNQMKRGKTFRFGHRHRLEGSDLIVWVKKDSTKPIKILLSPAEPLSEER